VNKIEKWKERIKAEPVRISKIAAEAAECNEEIECSIAKWELNEWVLGDLTPPIGLKTHWSLRAGHDQCPLCVKYFVLGYCKKCPLCLAEDSCFDSGSSYDATRSGDKTEILAALYAALERKNNEDC
jgi:hypothetical protein